jgi:lipopolysaccharide transport system ATP-binding protein
MSETVLKVENLSKLYELGEVGTGTLSHDLNRWWAKMRGKEDPFALVGQINDRNKKAESDFVWSLKDINFEVKQGEVLGIIGRNGAGKSTLLKIISQITSPTTGSIKAKGRIASLLEVGTGMNPELTARENIYLNGAILGMTRREIAAKFDEIVDFSGCTMYVDTPVKRFSSGMRVRLGFAVAAFLEPEILIVDEVLAVGDAEFQKKAIGKMKDISEGGGRTVLFVSHNMAAVEQLCSSAILLDNGMIKYRGETKDIIEKYTNSGLGEMIGNREWLDEITAPGNRKVKILTFNIQSDNINTPNILDTESGLKFSFKIRNYTPNSYLGFNAQVLDQYDTVIFTIGYPIASGDSKDGVYQLEAYIPHSILNQGLYKIKLWFGERGAVIASFDANLFQFEVLPKITKQGINPDRLPGIIIPKVEYKIMFL